MSQPEIEEALLLLRKAQEDLDVVRKLVSDTDIADSAVGFHAQQAAEKALKAVLAASGDDFPWTHDLRHLMDRLEATGNAAASVAARGPGADPVGCRVPVRGHDR